VDRAQGEQQRVSMSPNPVLVVDFDLPFPVHVTSEPFAVGVDGTPVTVVFEKVRRKDLDPRLRMGGGDFDLREDRFGWAAYSKVVVRVPGQLAADPPPGLSLEQQAVEVAVTAANDVLSMYREVTGSHWIRPVSPPEVWAYDVYLEEGTRLRPMRRFRRTHQMTRRVKAVSAGVEAELRRRLQEAPTPDASAELLLDAEDAMAHANPRLAVVLGQLAVETRLNVFLKRSLRAVRTPLATVRKDLNAGQALSCESAVDEAPIHRKLSEGVCRVLQRSPADDGLLAYEWEAANALRVSCIHHGHEPTLSQARVALGTYHRIIHEYLSPVPAQAPPTDILPSSLWAIQEATGSPPDRRLVRLLSRILPRVGKALTFAHVKQFPVRVEKGPEVHAQEQPELICIWLDPAGRQSVNHFGIAQAVTYFSLVHDKYPTAYSGPASPEARFFWLQVARILEKSVLQRAANVRLRKSGYRSEVRHVAQQFLLASLRRLRSSDFTPPQETELRAFSLPLEALGLYFSLSTTAHRRTLLRALDSAAPESAAATHRLISALRRTGFTTPQQCVNAMVACRRVLWRPEMMESVLIHDPVARKVHFFSRGAVDYADAPSPFVDLRPSEWG
jgi:hypothetical protein